MSERRNFIDRLKSRNMKKIRSVGKALGMNAFFIGKLISPLLFGLFANFENTCQHLAKQSRLSCFNI